MKIRLNSIDYKGSIVDGPGIRVVLFLQGCKKRCEGCHNPIAWDVDKGNLIKVEELVAQLKEKCLNKKITISGGEPLLQYSAILELVRKLRDFDIALYTGFDFGEIPEEILNHVNYVKVGKFIKEQKTTLIPFIGSSNQKFIDLRGGLDDEIN